MDLSKVCRSCMKEVASWEVGNFDQRAVQMFIFCTNIEVINEDKLPKQFCYDCTIKVESAYTFIKKAQEVNITLKNLLSRSVTSVIVEPESQLKNFTEVPVFNEHLYGTLDENPFFNNIGSSSNTDLEGSYEVGIQDKSYFENHENVAEINNDFQNNKAILVEENRYAEKDNIEDNYMIEETHNDDNSKEILKVCPICQKVFDNESWYISHIRDIHKESIIYSDNIDLNVEHEDRNNLNIEQNSAEDNNYNSNFDTNSEIITYNVATTADTLTENCSNNYNQTPDITELLSENMTEKETVTNNTDLPQKLSTEKPKEANKKIICPVCHKAFVLEGWLQKHILKKHNTDTDSKENNKQWKEDRKKESDVLFTEVKKCPLCSNEFASKLWFTKHLEGEHSDCKVYLCSLCYSPFLTNQELQTHPCPERRLACSTCGKRFRKSKQLRAHDTTHRTARPFACHKCDQRFKVKSVLVTHLKLHEGTRPYLCHVCGDSFTVSSSLDAHMRRHSLSRPHVCGACPYRAASASTLAVHLRRHRRARPHICRQCAATFVDRATLLRHSRIHSGARPYRCSVCGARFPDTWKCKLHMMRTHSIQLQHIPRLTKEPA